MKKILLTVVMIAAVSLITGTGIAGQKGVATAGASYNSAVVYAGEYSKDMLLCKNHSDDTTWRLIPYFDRLYKVTCQEALDSLNRTGTWQGHLNIKDGTCASVAEPAEWITGNRRNYDKLVAGDVD